MLGILADDSDSKYVSSSTFSNRSPEIQWVRLAVFGFIPEEKITPVEIENIPCARRMQHGNETADVAVHETHGATASSNQTSTFQFKN
jgi:hypothetical protein